MKAMSYQLDGCYFQKVILIWQITFIEAHALIYWICLYNHFPDHAFAGVADKKHSMPPSVVDEQQCSSRLRIPTISCPIALQVVQFVNERKWDLYTQFEVKWLRVYL